MAKHGLSFLLVTVVVATLYGGLPPLGGGGQHSSLFLGTLAAGAPEAAAAEFLASATGVSHFPGGGSSADDFIDLISRDAEALAQQQIPFGHKYITGGAGEGDQQLGPEEMTFEHREQVKSDNVLPAYCEPPNPCPIGFTAADGCLEEFDNSADFSRNYQAQQQCLCDAEHMFHCPGGMGGGEKEAAGAQQQQQEYEEGLEAMLAKNGLHKSMIAKKFHETRPLEPRRRKRSAEPAVHVHRRSSPTHNNNPYLRGTPLRSVAKKNGMNLSQM